MANGIRINLDTASKNQLISEVDRLKSQLESKNISLKINDDNIKNQIESMRVILDSLSNNTKPIDIKLDSIKAKEELAKIKGSFENIISEYSKLGNIKVTQNFDNQGQLESFVVKLEQVNGLIEKIKYSTSNEGLFTFQGSSVVNNINDTVQKIEDFKTKYQNVLKEIRDTKFIDEDVINQTQQKLDSLNLDNFKKISEEIKVDFSNLNNVFKNVLKIDDFKRQYNKKISDFEGISKYVSPEQVNNLKQQLNNLTGVESFTDIQKIKDGYDELVKSEKIYTKQVQQNAKEAREAINNQIENYRLLESQIQKINNIKNQYSTKFDLGSNQYKELDTIYNGLINKLNKYKELGQSLNVIETDNLKKEINGLKDKAKSIENVTNIIKQQENAVDALKTKFGTSLSDDLVKEYKNTLQNLYTSPNVVGDTNDLKKWLSQIKKATAEIERLKTLGKNIGNFSDNGLNMDSSLKDLRKYVREIDGYKASITSIDETTDKFGNNIKTVNYSVNEGHNIVRRYKMVLDESTNSIYKQSNGLQDLSSKHASFREKLQNSISAFLRFQVVAAGVMGVINQIKEGINTVNELNKSETTISMVMGTSAQEAENIKKQMSDLATQYHSTTKEMMAGAEEYIRAGNDIEQTTNLLKATTVGATLSGQDTKTVTEQLIAISNGFKMNTKDAKEMMSVIDQLTLADNESASSFAEIATAMQESSNMAQSVKVDFSHLLSYISTVSSVTRESATTVGNSFAAQFARYQNVKGGKDFDAYGEPLR